MTVELKFMWGCKLRVNQPKESVPSSRFGWGECRKGRVTVLLLRAVPMGGTAQKGLREGTF